MSKLSVGVLDLLMYHFYTLALLTMYTYVNSVLFVMLFGLMGGHILGYYSSYILRVRHSFSMLQRSNTMGIMGIVSYLFVVTKFDNG
jgi:hypothetical protein